MTASAETRAIYAFDVTIHTMSRAFTAGAAYVDALGSWPTLDVTPEQTAVPLAVGFEKALERLGELQRMYVEPDGSFVWTSPREGLSWQVDGNACEKDGRLLLVDLKGSCPPPAFDRLLSAFGWPDEQVMMQLVRPAVFLDEATFRRHALARGAAGDGETLRPR